MHPTVSRKLCFSAAIAASLLAAAPIQAVTLEQMQSQFNAILSRSNVSGNSWSVYCQNEWGTTTYFALNVDTPRKPASNTKLYTTAAAYEQLAWDHVWPSYGKTILTMCSEINKPSDNTKADNLLAYIGQQERGSATYSAGAADVLAWCSAIGIDMTGAQMYDGSGLSHSNRFTARQTMGLIRHMWSNYQL